MVFQLMALVSNCNSLICFVLFILLHLQNTNTELPKTDITSDTQLQGDTKCYLRAKVQCAKDVELQLMIGDVFTDPEFVEASNNESAPSYKCLPAPCTRDGKVVGNIVVIGNEITVEPELLKDLKAYTSEDECDMAKGDEHFEVTCNDEEFFQNEIQGQYFY